MQQKRHQDPDEGWPQPMANGVLIEVDFEERQSVIIAPGGDETRSLNSGVVRNVSPQLPEAVQEKFLPDGPGSVGKRILFPKSMRSPYLEDHVLEAVGLTVPTDDNAYGNLAEIDVRRLVAIVPDDIEDDNPPFQPLGGKVFLDFDYDEDSAGVVGVESGEKYEDPEANPNELVVPEQAKAQEHSIATVTKTGPDSEHVYPGQRVIPPSTTDAVDYKDETYFFVPSEADLLAALPLYEEDEE